MTHTHTKAVFALLFPQPSVLCQVAHCRILFQKKISKVRKKSYKGK